MWSVVHIWWLFWDTWGFLFFRLRPSICRYSTRYKLHDSKHVSRSVSAAMNLRSSSWLIEHHHHQKWTQRSHSLLSARNVSMINQVIILGPIAYQPAFRRFIRVLYKTCRKCRSRSIYWRFCEGIRDAVAKRHYTKWPPGLTTLQFCRGKSQP